MTEISASQFGFSVMDLNRIVGDNPENHMDPERVYAGVVPDVTLRGRHATVDFVMRAGRCAADLADGSSHHRWVVDTMPDAAQARGIPGTGDFGGGLSLDIADTAKSMLPEHRLVVVDPSGEIRLTDAFMHILGLPVLRVMCLEVPPDSATMGVHRPELRLPPLVA